MPLCYLASVFSFGLVAWQFLVAAGVVVVNPVLYLSCLLLVPGAIVAVLAILQFVRELNHS